MKNIVFSVSACLFMLLNYAPVHAQTTSNEPVLFYFGENSVTLDEFDYVYRKNNLSDDNAYSRKSLEEYLDLYINFRLKVKEAESLGLDTLKSIRDELSGYRNQLAKSYMQDRDVSEQLLQEAYERMKFEVRAAHILFNIEGSGLPADTLKAFNLANDVRKRILKGENFEKLAAQFSSDPSVKDNGGDIGYFTVLQTVYPFETAAYTTQPGQISLPVRTRFGYHLVKVIDKREAQGKINVAHILMKFPENKPTPEHEAEAKSKAEGLVKRIKDGESFEELARKFSDDKISAGKGGVLPEFGTGKMVMEFEKAAFSLKKDGDISEPVRTDFGYHIIKRISKPALTSYDEAKIDLKKRIERDTRSALATHVLVDRVKKENNFKEFPKNKEALYKKIQKDLENPKFNLADKKSLDKPLFELAGRPYTQLQFVEFVENQQSRKREDSAYKMYEDLYEKFVEKSSLDYQDSRLEFRYPEFKALMQEYRDGTLLFALTDQKVWSKALQDTTGLKAFHESNKNKYLWDQRLRAVIFTAKDEKTAKAARKLATKGKLDTSGILEKANAKSAEPLLTSQENIFEKGQQQLIDKIEWKAGVSENFTNPDNTISFVQVKSVIPPTPKTLDEARGFIVSDYQEFLEKEWIKELRQKYPVKVNNDVFSKLIKNN